MYYCEGCRQIVDFVTDAGIMLGGAMLCDHCLEQENENLQGWWKEDVEAFTPPEYCD